MTISGIDDQAGRDGLPADCILYYGKGDYGRVKKLLTMSKRENRTSQTVFNLHLQSLDKMKEYCENKEKCRRNILVEHFNENANCERMCSQNRNLLCDNCKIHLKS